MSLSCTLCHTSISKGRVTEGAHTFCCHGCRAVFNVLSSKEVVEHFQEHPIFRQAVESGLISNPDLLDQLKKEQPSFDREDMERIHIEVEDMWCPSCADIIKWVVQQEKGVNSCIVDYSTDLASIEYSLRYLSKEKICSIIKKLGYEVRDLKDPKTKGIQKKLFFRFGVSAFCSINIMMFSYPIYSSFFHQATEGYISLFVFICFFLSLPVLFFSAWPIYKRFWNSVRIGFFGMETLVMIGVNAAFFLSCYNIFIGTNHIYFDSMSLIITFVLLGKMIEAKAKFSSKDALLQLSRSLPKKGRKNFPDGRQAFVPIKEIQVGDILSSYCGEKVILDGVVVKGSGACDESLLTGESIPVIKNKGSVLIGGSIVKQGSVEYRVTRMPEESSLQRIIEMVEKDIGKKAIYVRFSDQIIRWFVPVIFLIALGVVAYCVLFDIQSYEQSAVTTGIIRAISVLLISCPCAIGIAAPLAESQCLNALAKLGVIVRNRGCLSLLGKESIFVFDKTGTITEGKFRVLFGLDSLLLEEKLILKALTKRSIHPISHAIFLGIKEGGRELEDIEEIAGRGIIGVDPIRGDIYRVGSKNFMKESDVNLEADESSLPIALEEEDSSNLAKTRVYFSKNNKLLTEIHLGDSIKEGAKKMLASLAKTTKTLLLSGDNLLAVRSVADCCGFDSYQASCDPLKKREVIETLKEKEEVVCMLGDGINDAPALTSANIGISVVSATDVSIQVSDLLLTTNQLTVLPKVRLLAKKGHRIVKQNIFWAFFYNCVGVILAVCGLLSPVFSAIAMVLSSLIVIFNARRIS